MNGADRVAADFTDPMRDLEITDTRHREFASVMGFPGFYGENWDAWIDCMSYLTSPDAGMTAFHLASDEELRVDLVDGTRFSYDVRRSLGLSPSARRP